MLDSQHQASYITKKHLEMNGTVALHLFFFLFSSNISLIFHPFLNVLNSVVVRVRAQQLRSVLLRVLFSKDYFFPPQKHV